MTGIKRLRELTHRLDEPGRNHYEVLISRELADIAGQIAREHAEDCYRMGLDYGAVSHVVADMERHVSGVEGAEDSPVAHWARELREALGCADEADEDREAIAWVREHGGLEKIIQQRRDSVPRAAFERKLGKRLRHIAECEEALRRRNATIYALERTADLLRKQIADMRPRLMPDGMEWLLEAWPRFEDDAPLKLGDMALIDGDVDMVEAVQLWIHGKPVVYGDGGSQQLERGERVKRPVADTWERLEKDANAAVCAYFGTSVKDCESCDHNSWECSYDKARDLVRRAKALAGDA